MRKRTRKNPRKKIHLQWVQNCKFGSSMAFANRIPCYVCNNRFRPQNMSRIYGDENREICKIAVARRDGFERAPQIIEHDTRVCFNCYQSIERKIRIIQENPMSFRLNVLKKTRNNSCFICNGVNDLHRLSIDCKVQAFIMCNIFFPKLLDHVIITWMSVVIFCALC